MAAEDYFTIPAHINRETIARIFSKIQINQITGCWEWTAFTGGEGYGSVWWQTRMMAPHRVLYAWLVGPAPKGVSKTTPQLDHAVCENRRCCNPAHLKLVLPKINSTRGDKGFGAINAKKAIATCGHPLPSTPDRRYGTARRCVECTRERSRIAKNRRREAAKIARRIATAHLPKFCRNGHEQPTPRPATCVICARKTKRDWKLRQKAKRQQHMGF